MPRQGKLPLFIDDRRQACSWPGAVDLAAARDLPPGCRVKAFRFTFKSDFRMNPWGELPAEITFAYASSPGGGLRIIVV
jgi:hypothetical protein